MKTYIKTVKAKIAEKHGMTLVEVLVAMSILMLIIFTFTPLFANYYRNIYTAGEVTKSTFNKGSLMERLFSSPTSSPDAYLSSVSVPLKLTATAGGGSETIEFVGGGSTNLPKIEGWNLTTDGSESDGNRTGNASNYTSFYIPSASSRLICFPKALTDDFIDTQITLFGTGDLKFESNSARNIKLQYTAHNGALNNVPAKYYKTVIKTDSATGENYAVITLMGGNKYINFQNSPIVITYTGATPLSVEIGAPKIIAVGEASTQTDGDNPKYYYYATSGVDLETGHMDIIAKEIKSATNSSSAAAELNSAMNAVKWVPEGMGSDENGNSNTYGYYLMGGDNGQIRRFWRNETTGNYYWGGDTIVNLEAYKTVEDETYQESSWFSTTTKHRDKVTFNSSKLTEKKNATSASYKFSYNSTVEIENDLSQYENEASYVSIFSGGEWLADQKVYFANYGTVTATNSINNANLPSGFNPVAFVQGTWRVDQYSGTTHGVTDSYYDVPLTASYNDITGDPSDNPITITAVAGIPLINNNTSAYITGDSAGMATNVNNTSKLTVNKPSGASSVYPTKSYSLYCGTIPAYASLIGQHWRYGDRKNFTATLGVGTVDNGDTYGVTGLFGDPNTTIITDFNKTYSARTLLKYTDDNLTEHNNERTLDKKSLSNMIPGSLLSNFRQDGGPDHTGGVTAGRQVAITIGYLSQPFANSTRAIPSRTGNSQDYLLGNLKHNFYAIAPREFSTFLDIVSFRLDVLDSSGNVVPTSFSLAAGYGLGLFCADIRGATRLTEAYNVGTIYIRSSGNTTSTGDNDTIANQLDAGKGWSMQLESNIFHPFYGMNEHAEGDYIKLGTKKSGSDTVANEQSVSYTAQTTSCYGWNEKYHLSDQMIMQDGTGGVNFLGIIETNADPAVNREQTHVLMHTRCTSVDQGINPLGCPEFMVGTDNGTVLSWYYDQTISNKGNSHNKISRAMKKEFESYTWSDDLREALNSSNDSHILGGWFFSKIREKLGLNISDVPVKNYGGNYDYWSTLANGGSKTNDYSFISPLVSIKDIKFGDDYWVAVGQQGTTQIAGNNNYKCGSKAYKTIPSNPNGSYICVRYNYDENDPTSLAWKAVEVDAGSEKITFINVEYCEGIWYAFGFFDVDNNGVQNPNDPSNAVVFYATDPTTNDASKGGWQKAITCKYAHLKADGTVEKKYSGVSGIEDDDTTAVSSKDGDDFVAFQFKGINAMASQG